MAYVFVRKVLLKTAVAETALSPLGVISLLAAVPVVRQSLRHMREKRFTLEGFLAAGCAAATFSGQALTALEIDHLGLDSIDHRMLRSIIENYRGGPVGLETLAATINEEAVTLEDVYEPYLMQMGMLTRTPRGRCVTRLAYEHLHMAVPRRFDDNDNGQQSMF